MSLLPDDDRLPDHLPPPRDDLVAALVSIVLWAVFLLGGWWLMCVP